MEILIEGKEFSSRKRGVRVIRVRVTVEIKLISLGSAYPAIPRSVVPKLLGSLPWHVSHHTYRAVSTCLQERLLSNLDYNLTRDQALFFIFIFFLASLARGGKNKKHKGMKGRGHDLRLTPILLAVPLSG